MDNEFEPIGGKISRKCYLNRMRILMNNSIHSCRKNIIDGKYRSNSIIYPKQWEDLMETMCSEEYFSKSTKGKKASKSVRDAYTFG